MVWPVKKDYLVKLGRTEDDFKLKES